MDSSSPLFQLGPVCCSQDQRLPCCHQDVCNFLSLRRSEPEETIARALCGSGKTPGTRQAVTWTTASFRDERKRASSGHSGNCHLVQLQCSRYLRGAPWYLFSIGQDPFPNVSR